MSTSNPARLVFLLNTNNPLLILTMDRHFKFCCRFGLTGGKQNLRHAVMRIVRGTGSTYPWKIENQRHDSFIKSDILGNTYLCLCYHYIMLQIQYVRVSPPSVYAFVWFSRLLIGRSPILFLASDWSESWRCCKTWRLRVFVLFKLSTLWLISTFKSEILAWVLALQ